MSRTVETFFKLGLARQIFVRKVCRWGNYDGLGGRVLKNNTETDIESALRRSVEQLSNGLDGVAQGIATVRSIKYLGGLSFASKHLRFLRPDACPVFDSVLQAALPYAPTNAGYCTFARDCQEIAKALSDWGVQSPWREGSVWLTADAEAALFEYHRSQ